MKINDYGYPIPDRLEEARAIAEEARVRIANKPCDCPECVSAEKLPGVLRMLSKYRMKDAP